MCTIQMSKERNFMKTACPARRAQAAPDVADVGCHEAALAFAARALALRVEEVHVSDRDVYFLKVEVSVPTLDPWIGVRDSLSSAQDNVVRDTDVLFDVVDLLIQG